MLETLILKNGNNIAKKPEMTSTFSMENLLNSKIVGKLSGQKNIMIKIKKERMNRMTPDSDGEWRGSDETHNDYYSENSVSPQNPKSDDSENKEYTDGSPEPEHQGPSKDEDDRYEISSFVHQTPPQQQHAADGFQPTGFFKQEGVLNQFFRGDLLGGNLVNRNSIFVGHNSSLCNLECCKKGLPFFQHNRNYQHQCSGLNCVSCAGNVRVPPRPDCMTGDKCEPENVAVNLKMSKVKSGCEEKARSPMRTNESPDGNSEHSGASNAKPILKFSVSAILGTDKQTMRQNQGEYLLSFQENEVIYKFWESMSSHCCRESNNYDNKR